MLSLILALTLILFTQSNGTKFEVMINSLNLLQNAAENATHVRDDQGKMDEITSRKIVTFSMNSKKLIQKKIIAANWYPTVNANWVVLKKQLTPNDIQPIKLAMTQFENALSLAKPKKITKE